MKKKKLLTIKDDKGYDIPLKEAAKRIGDCKPSHILHYMKKKTMSAKSLADVREIRKNLKEHGNLFYRQPKYIKTKYGLKTSMEIWEMHPHKINIRTVRVRVCNYGGMDERLWGPSIENGRHANYKAAKCVKCERKLSVEQFETITVNGTKHDTCNKCRGIKRQKRKVESVQIGETVISEDLKYKVCEILEVDGSRPLVSGHRIMENGQVLKNTVKHLVTNWRLESV